MTCKNCIHYDVCKSRYPNINWLTNFEIENCKNYKNINKAVKKQKPQKVIYEDVGYDCFHNENVYACICPSCRLHIFEFTDSDISGNGDFGGNAEKMFHSCLIHHDYRGLNNYCNRCGQKLDWLESEETE